MIIPDVNVLVFAHNRHAPNHTTAFEWWKEALNLERPIGLPWVVVLGFIRIVTNRRILTEPLRVSDATGLVRQWFQSPRVQIITPGERHAEILFGLLEGAGTAGDLTTDAHLAAMAIEYQAEIATTDADFSRFPGLRWFNPLAVKKRRGKK